MDKPISVGDLAQVVRCDHVHGERYLGMVYLVSGFGDLVACGECAHLIAAKVAIFAPGRALPLSWLKRIPPLSDLRGKKDAADKPITLDGQIERLRKLVQA